MCYHFFDEYDEFSHAQPKYSYNDCASNHFQVYGVPNNKVFERRQSVSKVLKRRYQGKKPGKNKE